MEDTVVILSFSIASFKQEMCISQSQVTFTGKPQIKRNILKKEKHGYLRVNRPGPGVTIFA